jgi:hypothetical protein
MNNDSPNNELTKKYSKKLIICIVLLTFLSLVSLNENIEAGFKILILMSGGILLFAIQLVFYQKNSEIKCSNCDKPVLLKPSHGWKKYEPYTNCYFCGHDLTK